MGKYLDKIHQHEHTHQVVTEEASTKQKALDPIPTIPPGDRITWTRADGTTQTGVVDLIHVDDTGAHWALVTLEESWAVVNLKFVKGSGQ